MMLRKMFLPYGYQPSAQAGRVSMLALLLGWLAAAVCRFCRTVVACAPLGRAMGFFHPPENSITPRPQAAARSPKGAYPGQPAPSGGPPHRRRQLTSLPLRNKVPACALALLALSLLPAQHASAQIFPFGQDDFTYTVVEDADPNTATGDLRLGTGAAERAGTFTVEDTPGQYGNFALSQRVFSSGVQTRTVLFTYTLDNDNTDVDALNDGDALTETFTVNANQTSGPAGNRGPHSATVTIIIQGATDVIPGLDLTLGDDDVTASPPVVVAGRTFTLTVMPRTSGAVLPVNTPLTVRYFIDTDGDGTIEFSPGSVDEATGLADIFNLASEIALGGDVPARDADIPVSADAPGGDFVVGACIFSLAEAAANADAAGNCDQTMVTVTPLPNLMATSATFAGNPPTVNETGTTVTLLDSRQSGLTLDVAVANAGSAVANAMIQVYRAPNARDAGSPPTAPGCGSDNVLCAAGSPRTVGDFASGGTTPQASGTFTAPADAGLFHYFACFTDAAETATLTDNCTPSIPARVGGAALSVTVAVARSLAVSSGATTPATASVTNNGAAFFRFEGGLTVNFYRSGPLAGTDPVPDLPTPLGSSVGMFSTGASFNLNAAGVTEPEADTLIPSAPGTYYYFACATSPAFPAAICSEAGPSVTVTAVDLAATSATFAGGLPAFDENMVAVTTIAESTSGLTLNVAVANSGDAATNAMIQVYRSPTAVVAGSPPTASTCGTDNVLCAAGSPRTVGAFVSGGTTPQASGTFTASADPDLYYYFACFTDAAETATTLTDNCTPSIPARVGTSQVMVTAAVPSAPLATENANTRVDSTASIQNTMAGRALPGGLRLQFYQRAAGVDLMPFGAADSETDFADMTTLPVSFDETLTAAAADGDGFLIPSTLGDYDYYACISAINDAAIRFCSAAVTVTVSGPLTFGAATIDAQTYTVGTGVSVTLPAAVGGVGDLTHAITEALPDGLDFDADTRVLSGAPTFAQPATTYTYTATDSDSPPTTEELPFTITITGPLAFGGATIDAQTYDIRTAVNLTLPTAAGGTAPYIYAITEALPDGLTFTAATRVLSGQPTATQDAMDYTYTATDSDSTSAATVELPFTIAITGPADFTVDLLAAQTYPIGTAVSVTLPTATGVGAITYAITESLPNGLTFTAASRVLSGTPTIVQPATPYTYTATDSSTPPTTDELPFTITISGPLGFAGGATIDPQLYFTNNPAVSVTLPAAGGGTAPYTYAIAPTLPGGLAFDGATQILSGVPTTNQDATDYTYTATDSAGTPASVSLTFSIAVARDSNPRFADTSFPTGQPGSGGFRILEVTNRKFFSLTLPEATGGNPPLRYGSVQLNRLPGLSLDPVTRVLSGTPNFSEDRIDTYHVIDVDGDRVTYAPPWTLRTRADVTPNLPAVPDQIYVRGVAFSVTLPAGTGGNGAISYSLTPALPANLTFDGRADRRTITGTAQEVTASADYTYTATDRDGSTRNRVFALRHIAELTFGGTNTGTALEPTIAQGDATTVTATGTVTITDNPNTAPFGGTDFAPQTDTPGIYGAFSIGANGAWTYTLANTDDDTNALAAGDTADEVFTAAAAASVHATRDVTITVTGSNDAPTAEISAPPAGTTATASEVITVTGSGADVDAGDVLGFAWTAADGDGNAAGSFADPAAASTTWTAPDAVGTVTLTLTVTDDASTPASGTATVDVMVIPVAFSGDTTGAVTEDAATDTATGTLTVTNSGSGGTDVVAQTETPGTYGDFTIVADTRAWTYALDNADDDTNALHGRNGGEIQTDTFTVTAAAGGTQDVVITITGANDAPAATITAPTEGMQVEFGSVVTLTATGGDVDDGDLLVVRWSTDPPNLGSFASPVFSAVRTAAAARTTWTVPSDSTDPVTIIMSLTDGDGIGVTTRTQVTVNPVAAAVTFGGETTGAVTEDAGTTTATGTLTVTTTSTNQTVVAQTDQPSTYGSFSITAPGVWTYTLNNANAATNSLPGGTIVEDTFTVVASANPASTVDVVIRVTGANDAPTVMITAPSAGNVLSGRTVTLEATGEDPDIGTPLAYAWTTNPANQGTFADAASPDTTWTPPTVNAGDSNIDVTLTLTVTDNFPSNPATATATLDLTVTGPGAPTADISATAPTTLTEANLDGATLTVTLADTTYATTPAAAQFRLAGVTGVTVSDVARGSNTEATLTLAFDRLLNDFDTNASLTVTVLDAAHTEAGDLNTDTVTVTAIDESDVATLAGLTLSGSATLNETFASDTFSYTADVAGTVTDIMVTPTATDATGATITVNGDAVNSGAASTAIDLTASADTVITVAVTAEDGTTQTYTLTVTRAAALALSFGGETIDAQTYTANTAITNLTLPVATGGTAPYSYALSDMPSALAFDAATRVLSGTPDAELAATTYTYTATDSAVPPAAVTLDLVITVAAEAASSDATLSGLTLSGGAVLAPVFAPTTLTYTADVANDVATLTVTPTATDAGATIAVNGTAVNSGAASTAITLTAGVATDIAVQVTAEDGTTQTYNLAVTRAAATTPTAAIASPSSLTEATLAGATVTVMLTNTEYVGTLVANLFSVTLSGGAAGVSVGAVTRTSAVLATLTLAYGGTGIDANTTLGVTVLAAGHTGTGDLDTATIPVTATPPPGGALSFGGATIDAQTYTANTAITDLTLPVVTGGTGTLSYALSDMPSGLSFNAMTRVLSGTPDREQMATSYTYTATDSASPPAAVTLSLVITVRLEATGGPLEGARSEAMEMTLGAFGRSFTSSAVEVLGERFSSGAGGSQLTFGGRTLSLESLTNDQAVANAGAGPDNQPVPAAAGGQQTSVGALFAGSAFQLSLNEGDAAGVGATTLWARGAVGNYEGEPEDGFQLDGDIVSGYLGLDYRPSRRMLVGVAVSHSRGDADFSSAAIADGEVETDLTSILPYVQWQPRAGLSVWGLVGYGEGESEITDSGESRKTDVEMQTAALGARGKLWSGGRADVALKASALTVEIESDSEQNLSSVTTRAHRLRMALEGNRHGAASARGGRFGQRFELGLRWDLGDVETGAGADLGAGVEYANPRSGTRLRLDGHYLLVHEESDFEAWEVSAEVGITPSLWGRGVTFALQPGWDSAGARQRMVMDFTNVLGPAWRGDGLKLELYGEHAEDHEFGLEGSVRY